MEKEMMDEHSKSQLRGLKLKADNLENVPESISEVTVFVKDKQENTTIETIQNVEIDTGAENRKKTPGEDTSQMTSLLAKQWNLTPDKIIISLEGGDRESE